jgi:hypothetical protein
MDMKVDFHLLIPINSKKILLNRAAPAFISPWATWIFSR